MEFEQDQRDDEWYEWMEWFAAQARFQHIKNGRVPYLPSPSEIEYRKQQVLWLQESGFSRKMIVNIMEYDHPSFNRAWAMVQRYGAKETVRRCSSFMQSTIEYG